MPFDIIAAAHFTNMAIGAEGKIPWKCSADMKFFRELTTTTADPQKVNAVVMGRTTYSTLLPGLKNRVNIILTKTPSLYARVEDLNRQVLFYDDFDDAINMLEKMPTIENIFVIGGEMVYKQAINHPKSRKIYLNKIHVPCDLSKSDTFFPAVDPSIYRLIEKKEIDTNVTSYVFFKLR